MKATIFLVATAAALAVFASGALPATARTLDIASQTKIDNGTVQLGVQPDGRLNAYDIVEAGDYFGLRYLPTGNESIALFGCEGWGAADSDTGSTGSTNLCYSDTNVEVESFTTTDSTAVSTVLIRDGDGNPLLRVTHDYKPSGASDDLYDVTVTIENVSSHAVDPRYRRVVNWDLEPVTFEEFVTIGGSSSPDLLATSNDGYSSPDPLSPTSCSCPGPLVDPFVTGFFTDSGPADQGSLFDLGFPSLAAGKSVQFHLFYGAAGSEDDATAALSAVGADFWTLAEPDDAADSGEPNTFILGFKIPAAAPTDDVAPQTTATPSPGPNGFGWNNTPVSVTLSATDNAGGSGVAHTFYSLDDASCTPASTGSCSEYSGPFTISSEGVHTVSFFSQDNAGNTEQANTLTVRIDTTKPIVTFTRTPSPNAFGWNNTNVTVHFNATDLLSGIAGSTSFDAVVSSEGRNQSVSHQFSDKAGNPATLRVGGINIDKTPARIVCSASPDTLWPPNHKLVAVQTSVIVTDGLSGPNGFRLVAARSSEPAGGEPDVQDWTLNTADTSGFLRAERTGDGTGRIYTLRYQGLDLAGNAGQCDAFVRVPHDLSQ